MERGKERLNDEIPKTKNKRSVQHLKHQTVEWGRRVSMMKSPYKKKTE